ncbi:HEAT repeat domain-containing protein, partial [Symmachiella dynata]|uniref:HEAT repeat domain-containing protein n=1 Tax=Symmachiella dynata TaxID=2527995 RepID=UPI0030EB6A02
IRDVRVEETLIQCLQNPELAGMSAQSLGFLGSQRACPALRQILNTEPEPDKQERWNQSLAISALRRLRDPASVSAIVRYLESEHGAKQYDGTISLGCIGTEEAETALLSLNKPSKELLVRGLVHFGSPKCVERAIEIAKENADNPATWLVEQCRLCFFGGSSREYRTDVAMEQFLEFVLADELTTEMCDHLCSIVNGVDSPSVRDLLRNWYDRRGTLKDTLLESPKDTRLSDVAFRQLEARGDEHVLDQHIRNELDHYKDYEIHDWVIERLAAFDRTKVQEALREALHVEEDEKKLRVILELIGHVGDDSDIAELEKRISAESDIVANAAFEATLRLTDPLRLAEHW